MMSLETTSTLRNSLQIHRLPFQSSMMNVPIVRDFLPIPDTVTPVTDPEHKEVAHSITQSPTDSHALAQVEREEKGAAQEGHDAEVLDLGWNQHPDKVAKPLIAGLENEEIWLLVRRFNKVRAYFSYTVHPG